MDGRRRNDADSVKLGEFVLAALSIPRPLVRLAQLGSMDAKFRTFDVPTFPHCDWTCIFAGIQPKVLLSHAWVSFHPCGHFKDHLA